MTSESIIKIDHVSFSYKHLAVLEDVTLDIKQGEFLGLVGPNGGGKSTLIKVILGLIKPQKGSVSIMGMPTTDGRKKVGYVPQYSTLMRNFPITVEDTVLLGLLGKTKPWFGYSKTEQDLAQRSLKEAQISELATRQLDTLSGGQFQRVLIARALISNPEVLILDEPTANVDQHMESNIFDLLKKLNEKTTIIVVSHDIGFISEYVNRVACLNKTLVCHETSCISGELIEDMYGNHVHMINHQH